MTIDKFDGSIEEIMHLFKAGTSGVPFSVKRLPYTEFWRCSRISGIRCFIISRSSLFF